MMTFQLAEKLLRSVKYQKNLITMEPLNIYYQTHFKFCTFVQIFHSKVLEKLELQVNSPFDFKSSSYLMFKIYFVLLSH